MTPIFLWTRIALLAFSGMTASCAVSPPPSAAPPRLILPQAAATPCVLERLPEAPTQADLEVAYVERGLRLIACESARGLAVETLLAERTLQDRWRREAEARPRPGDLALVEAASAFGGDRPARPADHPAEPARPWQVLPGEKRAESRNKTAKSTMSD